MYVAESIYQSIQKFNSACAWVELSTPISIFFSKSDPLELSPCTLEPWRCRLLTTTVALPHGRQPNAIDGSIIPTPLAVILARFWPLSATATASKCRHHPNKAFYFNCVIGRTTIRPTQHYPIHSKPFPIIGMHFKVTLQIYNCYTPLLLRLYCAYVVQQLYVEKMYFSRNVSSFIHSLYFSST